MKHGVTAYLLYNGSATYIYWRAEPFREGEAKASPNRASELVGVDPKADDLLMARLKGG